MLWSLLIKLEQRFSDQSTPHWTLTFWEYSDWHWTCHQRNTTLGQLLPRSCVAKCQIHPASVQSWESGHWHWICKVLQPVQWQQLVTRVFCQMSDSLLEQFRPVLGIRALADVCWWPRTWVIAAIARTCLLRKAKVQTQGDAAPRSGRVPVPEES